MKRDELTLMRAIEDLSGPTTHTADLIAELEHELEVVELFRLRHRGVEVRRGYAPAA